MNYSKEIFKMLGIEPNEKFKVKDGSDVYVIDDNLKTWYINSGKKITESFRVTLAQLLIGKYEIVKLPRLTDAERNILESIDIKYNWIVRDKDDALWVFADKPILENGYWFNTGAFFGINLFKHIFESIEAGKCAYSIDELLNKE